MTAVHEAGHAVMVIEEGRRFEEVVLRRKGEALAFVKNVQPLPGDDEVVRILLGGIVAERLCQTDWSLDLVTGAHCDMCRIGDFFRGKTTSAVMVPWNVEATVERVARRWTDIVAVVTALVERRRLSYRNVLSLLRKARRPIAPPFAAATVDWTLLNRLVFWYIPSPRRIDELMIGWLSTKKGQPFPPPPRTSRRPAPGTDRSRRRRAPGASR